MKVESILIENFKLFDHLEVSFKNKTLNEISNRFLVLGDNGAGKTTLLQSIALMLGLATRQVRTVSEFDWIGFMPGRYSRWGTPNIKMLVTFTQEELEATRWITEQWYESRSAEFRQTHPYEPSGNSAKVELTLRGERYDAGSRAEMIQFQGRQKVFELLETNPSFRPWFAKIPSLFWFDQFRNLGSNPDITEANGKSISENSGRLSFDFGVARLRRYLNGWKLAQISREQPYQEDYLMNLENLYKRVFPGRSFAGTEPMPGVSSPTPDDYYFLLNDGHRTYDLVEMSAGEQSVFPILYQFVRLQIAHSIVLIDEIDLNLHPPAAQTLVSQLPKIGPTCQFIITTHSEAVNSMIGNDETFRLPGGKLCL